MLASPLYAKKIKIAAVPEDAKIFVDGNYIGDGTVTVAVRGDFISLKIESPGYVTIHSKFYKTDPRSAVSFNLRKDTFYESSTQNDNANNFFMVTINKKLYSTNEDGTKNSSTAWKMAHQIILNYFEEIQTSDSASGFIQTPWVYKTFPEAEIQVRCRVTVSESNLGGDLTYKVKVSSETAGLNAPHRDERFKPTERILKKYETLIEEFQTRLGENR